MTTGRPHGETRRAALLAVVAALLQVPRSPVDSGTWESVVYIWLALGHAVPAALVDRRHRGRPPPRRSPPTSRPRPPCRGRACWSATLLRALLCPRRPGSGAGCGGPSGTRTTARRPRPGSPCRRNGCASPATCTTCSATASPSSPSRASCRPSWPPRTRPGRERRCRRCAAWPRSRWSRCSVAVDGYRSLDLDEELAGRARRAGGGRRRAARSTPGPSDLSPPARTLLAWAVREGATNVLKHSRATRCSITIDGGVLEMRNDGVHAPAGGTGSGLRGLAERMATAGGSFSASPTRTGEFLLRAEGPGMRKATKLDKVRWLIVCSADLGLLVGLLGVLDAPPTAGRGAVPMPVAVIAAALVLIVIVLASRTIRIAVRGGPRPTCDAGGLRDDGPAAGRLPDHVGDAAVAGDGGTLRPQTHPAAAVPRLDRGGQRLRDAGQRLQPAATPAADPVHRALRRRRPGEPVAVADRQGGARGAGGQGPARRVRRTTALRPRPQRPARAEPDRHRGPDGGRRTGSARRPGGRGTRDVRGPRPGQADVT